MTRDEIFERIRKLLSEMFTIDPARITPESNLYTDLDLDSLDAIDLAVKLQEIIKSRVPDEALRAIRTVNDVIDVVQSQLGKQADPPT